MKYYATVAIHLTCEVNARNEEQAVMKIISKYANMKSLSGVYDVEVGELEEVQ